MVFDLLKLPYEYNALEPHIDEKTMTIHHSKHHQGYVDKLNAAIKGTDLEGKEISEILSNTDSLPEDKRTAIINNGGGHANHSLFWEVMAPKAGGEPNGKIADLIDTKFESFDKFKEEFSNAAATRFGSGWAWLVMNSDGELEVKSLPNQDSPLMDNDIPLLGLDVWEHAYYLKYQNKRPDYVKAFWNLVNWDKVNELLENK